jgi:hypothetical protein
VTATSQLSVLLPLLHQGYSRSQPHPQHLPGYLHSTTHHSMTQQHSAACQNLTSTSTHQTIITPRMLPFTARHCMLTRQDYGISMLEQMHSRRASRPCHKMQSCDITAGATASLQHAHPSHTHPCLLLISLHTLVCNHCISTPSQPHMRAEALLSCA